MYTIVAYTRLGQVFKVKKVEQKPTFKTLNNLANRWALQYGSHMNLVVTETR
jgi:hypothetical protein